MIGAIILGLIAGWITGLLMRGSGYGIIADIILGLIGGVIGRLIFGALGLTAMGSLGYLVMAVIGAVVLVGFTHVIRRAA